TMTDYDARADMQDYFKKHFVPQLPEAQVRTWVISTGPPSAYPVMIRVLGEDKDKVQELAAEMKGYYLRHPGIDPTQIKLDWYEKSKVLEMNIDQNRIRQLGINPQDLQLNLQSYLTGIDTTTFYFLDRQVGVVMRQRANAPNMDNLDYLKNVQIFTNNGYMPLSQVAKLEYKSEYGLINRRDLIPCVEVQADVNPGFTGNDVAAQLMKEMEPLIESLPFGYYIKVDGDLENSQRTSAFMATTYPFIALLIMVLLMLQLQHIGKMLLVLITAPLGLIGVNLALIILRFPMGFVAELGVIALAGMIMRNSVILIHCIHENVVEGQSHYDAIINACLMRFRPIMLTASAAICGMIPLFADLFWGPMAVAIAGGLISATILTLIFLPALYAICFRVQPGD
ncbi:MAG: efflux RND transporter permease subunit, partial [Negativicutes bacterium]|nr:efflux RND transporter permease subunit [Negativicutes bacterium]